VLSNIKYLTDSYNNDDGGGTGTDIFQYIHRDAIEMTLYENCLIYFSQQF
jgi:hypothetical protein